MPLVLPHEVIFRLHMMGRLEGLSPKKDVEHFWEHFKAHESSSIQWPIAAERHMLPVGIHCDDCRYTESGEKLIVLSLNFLLDGDVQDRFPLFVLRCVIGLHETKALVRILMYNSLNP